MSMGVEQRVIQFSCHSKNMEQEHHIHYHFLLHHNVSHHHTFLMKMVKFHSQELILYVLILLL